MIAEMGADRTSFDQIGAILNRQVSPTLRGPEKRTNPLNFFNEVTDEQLKTYTVLEIRTILEQRGNVSMCSLRRGIQADWNR